MWPTFLSNYVCLRCYLNVTVLSAGLYLLNFPQIDTGSAFEVFLYRGMTGRLVAGFEGARLLLTKAREFDGIGP